jgi:cAMP-dependent protein kinase regulator
MYEAKQKLFNTRSQRSSVSAEVYGIFNKKEAFVPRVIAKTEDQKARIISKVTQSFLFNSLEEKELNTVIDAFEEKIYKEGDAVITQGDQGDVLYLIESGKLDCFKERKDENRLFLKEYLPGDSFGELALLYNAPRAATIIAKTDCLLWALDRETFNNIVKDAAMKKREKYEASLKQVEILQSIDPYELSQICDALHVKKVKAGETIINQNEEGHEFYIIEEGEAFASKVFHDEGGKEEIVKEYSKGGYFGELALIKDEPRAASVVAKTDCKLLTLDRMSFKRLLGPLENILKRNSSAYVKYLKK